MNKPHAQWIRSMLVGCILISLSSVGAAGLDPRWTSHVSPSLIADISMRDGLLYMASSGGVLIYDPADSSFEVINNTSGLPSNLLTSCVFNAAGDLFVGTGEAGLAKLHFTQGGVQVTSINSSFQGLTDDRVTSVAVWGDTIVYGTMAGAGLVVKDFPTARFYVRDGLPDDQVNDVIIHGDEAWFGTKGGVAVLDRQGFIRVESDGLVGANVQVLAGSDTSVFAGTIDGVAEFHPAGGTWTKIGLPGKTVYSLLFDGSTLWAGTNDSLFAWDGAGWNGYSLVPVYIDYQLNWLRTEIRALAKTSSGDLYIGLGDWNTERRGCYLVSFDGQSGWREYAPNAPAANNIIRLSLDIDNSLWISTKIFGVGKLTPSGVWFNYNGTTPGGAELSTRIINNALLADSKGVKWFGSIGYLPNQAPLDELDDGLDLDYGNDVWRHHAVGSGGGDGLGTLRFIRAREDPAGNRWFLSDDFYKNEVPKQWGISILSEDTTEWLQVNPSSTGGLMKGGNVFDVAFGPGGEAYVGIKTYGVQKWFAGGYGKGELFDLTDDFWISIGEIGDEFSSIAEIMCLALRSDGVLWIGTTVGLYKYDRGSVKFIAPNRGFGVGIVGDLVFDLLLDDEENLWVATNLGLNRIAKDDDSDIQTYTTPVTWQKDLSLFFPIDVISPLVDSRCQALALDRDRDLLYIGTARGLSAFDISGLTGGETDLGLVYLYPNPVRASRGVTSLKIARISSPVLVEIFNLEGELVSRKEVSTPDSEVWDLTTEEGFLAAGGVYFARISNESGSVVKTISLIR